MNKHKPGSICTFLMEKWSKTHMLAEAYILDIGCGKGAIGLQLNPYIAEYIGLDLNLEKEVVNAQKNRKFVCGRGEEMPFANRTFDLLLFSMSWHLMENHWQALQEAKRVLKANGLVSILEVADDNENWKSNKLRKDNPLFDSDVYIHKIRLLQHGAYYLKIQQDFEIVEQQTFGIPVPHEPPAMLKYWTLKPRAQLF